MNRAFGKKELRKLIVPLILEQALAMMVGMADTMMISSAGEAAISGVSLVDMVNALIFGVFSALATGGAVITSQFLGAGKRDKACETTNQLLYTVTILGMATMVLTILLRVSLIRLFFGEIESEVMNNAMIYLIITAFSFPFMAIYNACAAIFRAMGNAAVTLWVSLLMNLINIIGNAICIYGFHMGAEGVAIPSVASRVVAAAVLYVLLKNQNRTLHFVKERMRLRLDCIRRILYIGVPSGIENGIFQLGRIVVVRIIAGFGTAEIAANSVANSLDYVGCIIGQATGLAMITVIGHCVGAGDEKQVRYYTGRIMKITYLFTAIWNLSLLFMLPQILSLYKLSAETGDLAYRLIMIHNGMAIFLWPAAFVLPNTLRACNDVRFTMVVAVASMLVLRIGFSYLLGVRYGMGAIGVWYAMVADWIVRAGIFIGRYAMGGWKRTMYGKTVKEGEL